MLKEDKLNIDIETDEELEKWVDPRDKKDRRKLSNLSLVPNTGCRRKDKRRNHRFLEQKEWWLQRGYSQAVNFK